MPWLTIIVWVISYFISSKSGMSKGQAALVATGAAAATYYVADPANKDNVLGVSMGGDKATPGDPTASVDAAGNVKTTTPLTTTGTTGSNLVTQLGETARSWGPIGTVGAVTAATGVVTGNKNLLWIGALAFGAILLLK